MHFRIDEDTDVAKIPAIAQYVLVKELANRLFSEPIANAVIDNSSERREYILRDLMRHFFAVETTVGIVLSVDVAFASLHAAAMHSSLDDIEPERKIQIASHNTVGLVYDVTIKDGQAVHCTCKGFYHTRACRHLAEAEALA